MLLKTTREKLLRYVTPASYLSKNFFGSSWVFRNNGTINNRFAPGIRCGGRAFPTFGKEAQQHKY